MVASPLLEVTGYKSVFMYADNKCTDQHVHIRILIGDTVNRSLPIYQFSLLHQKYQASGYSL